MSCITIGSSKLLLQFSCNVYSLSINDKVLVNYGKANYCFIKYVYFKGEIFYNWKSKESLGKKHRKFCYQDQYMVAYLSLKKKKKSYFSFILLKLWLPLCLKYKKKKEKEDHLIHFIPNKHLASYPQIYIYLHIITSTNQNQLEKKK